MSAQKALPRHIWCERHKCRITVTGCTLRLHRAAKGMNFAAVGRSRLGFTPYDPQCKDCPQGLRVEKGDYRPMGEQLTPYEIQPPAPAPPAPAKAPAPKPAGNTVTATKICKDCKQDLPLSAFSLDASTPDGHCRYCRECRKTMQKADRDRKKVRYSQAVQTARQLRSESVNMDEGTLPERRRVVIDFIGRESLLRRIEAIALEEFRTADQQILYWVTRHLPQQQEGA